MPPAGPPQKANKKPKGAVNTRKCQALYSDILHPSHKPQPYVSFLSFQDPALLNSSLPRLRYVHSSFFHPFVVMWLDHKSVAPKNENPTTMDAMIMGVLSRGWRDNGAALLLLVAVLEPVAAVTDPEPGVAVPVEVPAAFWLPFPERPAPFPAPVFINYYHISSIHQFGKL